MRPDEGGGGPSQIEVLRMVNPALASMLYDPESMTSFKKRVDDLLANLQGSPAAPKKWGDRQLTRSEFGGGDKAWAEAAGLFTAYDTVVSQLQQLSQLLADSMEGMGIAVRSSQVGYGNMDDDIRRRMASIHTHTKKYYDPKLDPTVAEKNGDGTTQPEAGAADLQ